MTPLLWVMAALAQDDDWGDADDVGFAAAAPAAEQAEEVASPFDAGGSLETEEALWIERLDSQPLAVARQSSDWWAAYGQGAWRARVSLHHEADLAYRFGSVSYDKATLDAYETLTALREAWVSGSWGPWDVAVGRQVVAWGEGLLNGVLDVVNPRDNREPGLADLEDLRLPVTMARVAWSSGSHSVEVMAVPEADFGLLSPPAGPFGLVPGLLDSVELPDFVDVDALLSGAVISWEHQQDRWAADQIQGFARWSRRGRGLDLSLYAASHLDQTGVIVMPDLTSMLVSDARIPLDHPRMTTLGHAGAKAFDAVLLRWELAYSPDQSLNTGDFSALVPELGVRVEPVVSGMAGASYAGLADMTVDVEVSRGWLPTAPEDVLYPVDALATALRIYRAMLRDRLELQAAAVVLGETGQYGWTARADAAYEVADGVSATVGVITYQPGEELGPFMGYDTHDRVWVGGRWVF